MNIEVVLQRIENKIDILLKVQSPIWISEAEAMLRIGRSKVWLKKQRLGSEGMSPTLILGTDWRKINGRTPENKASSIDARKRFAFIKKKITKTIPRNVTWRSERDQSITQKRWIKYHLIPVS